MFFSLDGASAPSVYFLLCLSPAETSLLTTLGLEIEQSQVIATTANTTYNIGNPDLKTESMKLLILKFYSVQVGRNLPS